MHFDHIGLAGRVREASGAWIALHVAYRDIVARPELRDAHLAAARQTKWLRLLRASEEEAAVTPKSFEPFLNIAFPDRLLAGGELADVRGWSLRAVHTPGHTPGHLCFVEERCGLFFSGDHVVPRITPNISAGLPGANDPLGEFLRSLQAVRSLEAREVLPAHEWRFRGLAERVDQLTVHHEPRLDEVLHAVREHPRSLPWELAGYVKWSRPWDQYEGHMRIFAVNETVAHLWHLVVQGWISRSKDAVPVYSAV
jgi:glyoxylase-like metal-dependent hydrolase (beta-lactamase superfamily II)